VELHGGRVEARSAGAERGSEFEVMLPCVYNPYPIAPQSPASVETAPVPELRHRVVIADDNRDGADSLAMLLNLSGFEVYTAHTGPEALEAAIRYEPRVAILDIGMPGMNGYELARRIRVEAWGTRMMLIAVTGWGQEQDKLKAQAAGFDHHFTKPVDFSALEQVLRSL
jgi:CheY-like chemotaxis protein